MRKLGFRVFRLGIVHRNHHIDIWDAIEGAVCCGLEHPPAEEHCRKCESPLKHRAVTLIVTDAVGGQGLVINRVGDIEAVKKAAIEIVDRVIDLDPETGSKNPDGTDEPPDDDGPEDKGRHRPPRRGKRPRPHRPPDPPDEPPGDPPEPPPSDDVPPSIVPPAPSGSGDKSLAKKIEESGWVGKAAVIWEEERNRPRKRNRREKRR